MDGLRATEMPTALMSASSILLLRRNLAGKKMKTRTEIEPTDIGAIEVEGFQRGIIMRRGFLFKL